MPTIKYNGDGSEFINSVPSRDLDENEYRRLPKELRLDVRKAVRSDGKPLYKYEEFRTALSAQDQVTDDDTPEPEPAAQDQTAPDTTPDETNTEGQS